MSNSNFMNVFADYNKSHEQKKRVNGSELLKKYFQLREGTQRIRLMPPLQGEKHFEEAYFHMIRETVYNEKTGQTYLGWKKHYCGASNDPKVQKLDANGNPVNDKDGNPYMVKPHCPLCAQKDAILATQDKSVLGKKREELTTDAQKAAFDKNKEIFKSAMQYAPKKYYLLRVVDLEDLGAGVKIWQFPHRKDKQGFQDKLMIALKRFHDQHPEDDWTSLENGATFELVNTMVPNKSGNGSSVQNQQIYVDSNLSPITEDPIIRKKLAEDNTKWSDLHKKKDRAKITHEQYLDRIIKGTNPYYNKQDKRWVFPDPADAALQTAANNRSDEDLTAQSSEQPQTSAEPMVAAAIQNEVTQPSSQPDMDSLTPEAISSMPTIEETNANSAGTEISDDLDDVDDLPF